MGSLRCRPRLSNHEEHEIRSKVEIDDQELERKTTFAVAAIELDGSLSFGLDDWREGARDHAG